MEIRSAAYTAGGQIDCEVNHPVYGWVPFSAVNNEQDPFSAQVFAAALAQNPAPYIPPPPAPPYVPPAVSKMQGILALGKTRWDQVLAYRETATWGEQVVIDSAGNWERDSQNIAFFQYLIGLTDAETDALFIAAAQITA